MPTGGSASPQSSRADAGYRVQIDGLRALAVACVLVNHYLFPRSDIGLVGVALFFVISGYLITGILVDARAQTTGGAGRILASFYARRILRLVPAYYLCLGLTWLTDQDGIRATIGWHLAYLTNMLMILGKTWSPWTTLHFWTLAVEEQFYLLWPLLLFALPARRIGACLAVIVGLGLLSRAVIVLVLRRYYPGDLEPLILDLPLPAVMHLLAAGAALAIVERRDGFPRWLPRAGLSVGLFCAAAFVAKPLHGLPVVFDYFVVQTLWLVPLAALVAGAATGFGGLLGRCLSARPVVWLGRISYGIYVFHIFALVLLQMTLFSPDTPITLGPQLALVGTPLAIALATLSYYLVEQPVLRLKRLFPYGAPAAPINADRTI